MGVKSLWQLLTPVGRPVSLESVEGTTMAIDSSIWIYQFQATMRDKEGHGLVNAHVLGFLRRICKLLFYGIKPVFVFDGGAPVLKRATITGRKQKKSGAAENFVKVAEKLLAAHMRREAVKHAQEKSPNAPKSAKGKEKMPPGPNIADENTVYLEDVDASVPKTPARKSGKDSNPSSASPKKAKFYDHDPYRLPDIDLDAAIANATRSTAPDPRLATEEELRAFIEDMRPEDFDVSSPAFRELPTEVQYEIIGDLRLKSRQTSYTRLQNMLKNAPTPLDFSRQQIMNLKQRNSLTQQLLTTTDSIGKAHVSIPVRIASERNREYVLVKNEGESGGWILGIRDDGTQAKPIQIDHDDEGANDDSESDMEEVPIPGAGSVDPDLREYQREMALSAIARRPPSNNLVPLTTRSMQKKTKPLFTSIDEDDADMPRADVESEGDLELAKAIALSLEQNNPVSDRENISQNNLELSSSANTLITGSSIGRTTHPPATPSPATKGKPYSDDEDLYASPTRLETVLSFANAGSTRKPISKAANLGPMFGRPSLLTSLAASSVPDATKFDIEDEIQEMVISSGLPLQDGPSTPLTTRSPQPAELTLENDSSDDDMEEVLPSGVIELSPYSEQNLSTHNTRGTSLPPQDRSSVEKTILVLDERSELSPSKPEDSIQQSDRTDEASTSNLVPLHRSPALQNVSRLTDSEDEQFSGWSRSPSPVADSSNEHQTVPPSAEAWDAAQEIDPHAEEGEFVRFLSQVKGKDLDTVRREIDDEIRTLNQQKKAAMRDSEDITQQMISQIMLMLRLFGIPYITAPMEAEAQCAELVSLGLVEGVITDDSDVFLFGGQRVFKNMFNQSKTVECFLLRDLARELGLERDALIRLAYLLGSDYVEGLPGVGPVVAMELINEFPGSDGLHKFKDWWNRVQTGKDRSEDNSSQFRKRFKKKFKNLYLPADWPNPAVRDAYYHPTVDSSEEPFKWGLPDLDALRDFIRNELGWSQTKVDELLLPIIQKMGKRGQAAALNKQGNLNDFFDVTAGSGAFAPRKRQAYASKRLQQVVSDFRSEQEKRRAGPSASDGNDSHHEDEAPPKKRLKTGKGRGGGTSSKKTTDRTRGRGRGARATSNSGRKNKTPKEVSSSEDEDRNIPLDDTSPPPLAVRLRPRPKPVLNEKQSQDASDST